MEGGRGGGGTPRGVRRGELERPAESFFEKRIASFSLPDVREVVLSHGGTTIELTRAAENAPWTGREGASAFAVEGTRVIDFLNKIRSLTASGFETRARRKRRVPGRSRFKAARESSPT